MGHIKTDYLESLQTEIDLIEKNAGAINYQTGALSGFIDKLKTVHKNFATLAPEKQFVDYTQWEVPTIMLLDMADPQHEKNAQDIAKLYVRAADAFAYWQILYALFFEDTAS